MIRNNTPNRPFYHCFYSSQLTLPFIRHMGVSKNGVYKIVVLHSRMIIIHWTFRYFPNKNLSTHILFSEKHLLQKHSEIFSHLSSVRTPLLVDDYEKLHSPRYWDFFFWIQQGGIPVNQPGFNGIIESILWPLLTWKMPRRWFYRMRVRWRCRPPASRWKRDRISSACWLRLGSDLMFQMGRFPKS